MDDIEFERFLYELIDEIHRKYGIRKISKL
jgi:hypothetical protein